MSKEWYEAWQYVEDNKRSLTPTPKAVTAEERANAVILQKNPVWYSKGDDSINDWATLAKEIAEQIKLAQEEARAEGNKEILGLKLLLNGRLANCHLAYQTGFAECKEEAAQWMKTEADKEWNAYLEKHCGNKVLISFDEFCSEHIKALRPGDIK